MNKVRAPDPIRVLIVDDQRAVLLGLAALIDSEAPHMQVAGQASGAQEAREEALRSRPHVVVLDADLGGEDGLALISEFKSICNAAAVVCTCLSDPAVHQRARQLGASHVVLKTAPGAVLLQAIRAAAV